MDYICPVCSKDTQYFDMCDHCYQVESNIEEYLDSKNGIERMERFIKDKKLSKLKKEV